MGQLIRLLRCYVYPGRVHHQIAFHKSVEFSRVYPDSYIAVMGRIANTTHTRKLRRIGNNIRSRKLWRLMLPEKKGRNIKNDL